MEFKPGQHIHHVGVGGFGVSAIARILLERGYHVSGSDRSANELTRALAADGATIYQGHDPAYVEGADMVITTSALRPDHVEIKAAEALGIPVYKRRDILTPLMAGKKVIAIAGTHGKTTTTSMIVHILKTCGLDPSYIVGGVMASTGTNAGVGEGDLFVVEADEYDYMFLGVQPDLAVLTSLEYDHPDFFPTEDDMLAAFRDFMSRLTPYAPLVACFDYSTVRKLADERVSAGGEVIGYGLDNPEASMQARHLRTDRERIMFDLHVATGGQITVNMGEVRLSLAGTHNVQNALAAITACDAQGVVFSDAVAALATFQSTGRRFEVRGMVNDIIVIDDYAHHPTAVRLTLEAARTRYPNRTLWAVWQPHMFSRTRQLIDAYREAFVDADHILVTAIYAARETPISGINAAWAAAQLGHPDARHSGDLAMTTAMLLDEVEPGSVILIMSAGDAPTISTNFLMAFDSE